MQRTGHDEYNGYQASQRHREGDHHDTRQISATWLTRSRFAPTPPCPPRILAEKASLIEFLL